VEAVNAYIIQGCCDGGGLELGGYGWDIIECSEYQVVLSSVLCRGKPDHADVIDRVPDACWGDVGCSHVVSFLKRADEEALVSSVGVDCAEGAWAFVILGPGFCFLFLVGTSLNPVVLTPVAVIAA